MRTRALSGLVLGASLVVVLVIPGCGRKRKIETKEGTVTVTQKGEKSTITFQGKNGEKATVEHGEDVSLPKDFPKDFPVYPGAHVTATTSLPHAGATVQLKSSDSVDQVVAFYKKNLSAQGWNFEGEMDMGGRRMLAARKGDRHASVMVQSDSGTTQILLTLGGAS